VPEEKASEVVPHSGYRFFFENRRAAPAKSCPAGSRAEKIAVCSMAKCGTEQLAHETSSRLGYRSDIS
jgi:hypothetical protein